MCCQFDIQLIKKVILFTLILILFAFTLPAQVNVTPNINAAQLAQALVGPGVVVSNANLSGSAANGQLTAGTFTASNSNLSFSNGVVLSTGPVSAIPGIPGTNMSISTCNSCSDSDLAVLASNSIRDAVVLEFDVLPISDTLKFNYIFASEEYPTYVCNINDVFGFFINGPGITGTFSNSSKNIALVPGTTTYVGINTINNGNPSIPGCTPTNSQYFNVNTAGSNTFVFNGYTTILQAKIVVIPCQTYKLRLKIGDASDGLYDSGVFIEGGSLSSSGVSLDASSALGNVFTNAVEGCLNGSVTFTRTEAPNTPQTVKYFIGGTATNGVDYQHIADSIIIPAGQSSAVLTIIPIQDNIPEGQENLIISITEPCQNNVIDSVVLVIQDSLFTNITGLTTICPYTTSPLNITGALNYYWTPAASLNNPNISNPIASPLSTTTYTVNSTVGTCSATDTFTVNVRPIPPVTAGPDTVLCFNAPVQMYSNAPTAVSRIWSPPVYLSSNNVANPVVNLPAGVNTINYIVTVTDNLGCKNRDTVSIVIDNMSGATVSADTNICAGDSATLTAGGGIMYSWSPSTGLSDPAIASPKASPATITTYTVRAFNAGGCYQDKTVTVTVNPIPVANAGADKTACVGGNVTLNGSGSGSYSWSPSTNLSSATIANPVFTPVSAGTSTYTLTVTSATGCAATDVVTIITSQLDFLTTDGDTTICGGIPVPISASGGSTYSWTPAGLLNNSSSATPTATVYGNTLFMVMATDANGCTDNDSVKVLLGSAGSIAFSPKDTLICPGSSVQLSASGGVNYSWSPTAGLSNPNIANPVATPVASTDYIITTTFANGCVVKDTIEITVEPLPVANAGTNTSICEGKSTTLNAGGIGSYSWSPATGLSNPNISNPVASPTSTTTYTLTVTNAAGCSSTDDVVISVNPSPTADAGADASICNGGNPVTLTATGGTSYSWSPATGLNNPNVFNPVANPSASTTYTVTVTNANGCTATDVVIVTVNNSSTVQAGPTSSICTGDSVQLVATGGSIYSWSPATGLNNANIDNPVAKPAVSTTYTVTVTDGNGCISTADVAITVNTPQPLSTGNDKSICAGDTISISASGNSTYSWSPVATLDNATAASPNAFPVVTTMYTVTGTDANGCKNIDSVEVVVTYSPPVNLTQSDTSICPGTSVNLGVSGGVQYQWAPSTGLNNPAIASPVASPEQTTTYNIRVTDNNNCFSDTSVTVIVYPITDADAKPDFSTLCEGDSITIFAANAINYEWSPQSSLSDPLIASPVAKPVATTIYTVTIFDMNGCIFTDSIEIEVAPAGVADAGRDTTIVIGTSIVINGNTNGNVTWTPTTGLNNPYIANPVASPVISTVYIMEVETADGCMATDTIEIIVNGESALFIPTAFSPNGDGYNDILILSELNGLELKSYEIFNRWGQKVFSTNTIFKGWDGTFEGTEQEIGVYFYKIIAVGTKGEIFDKQGTITLLR